LLDKRLRGDLRGESGYTILSGEFAENYLASPHKKRNLLLTFPTF